MLRIFHLNQCKNVPALDKTMNIKKQMKFDSWIRFDLIWLVFRFSANECYWDICKWKTICVQATCNPLPSRKKPQKEMYTILKLTYGWKESFSVCGFLLFYFGFRLRIQSIEWMTHRNYIYSKWQQTLYPHLWMSIWAQMCDHVNKDKSQLTHTHTHSLIYAGYYVYLSLLFSTWLPLPLPFAIAMLSLLLLLALANCVWIFYSTYRPATTLSGFLSLSLVFEHSKPYRFIQTPTVS